MAVHPCVISEPSKPGSGIGLKIIVDVVRVDGMGVGGPGDRDIKCKEIQTLNSRRSNNKKMWGKFKSIIYKVEVEEKAQKS